MDWNRSNVSTNEYHFLALFADKILTRAAWNQMCLGPGQPRYHESMCSNGATGQSNDCKVKHILDLGLE